MTTEQIERMKRALETLAPFLTNEVVNLVSEGNPFAAPAVRAAVRSLESLVEEAELAARIGEGVWARVLRGLHPLGRPLSLWPGARCGNCRWAVTTSDGGDKRYWKCARRATDWTAGPGSDLRLGWRGCDWWVPGPNGRVIHVFRGKPPAGAEQLHPRDPHRFVERGPADDIRWLVPAWWRPVPGMAEARLPEVAVHLMGLLHSVEYVEDEGVPMRLNERMLTHAIMVEELAPSADHLRVALARLVDVVAVWRLEQREAPALPAARLLLKAVEAGVKQARAALEPVR